MNTLGERIFDLRKRVNLTQEQLAEKCGVTAQAVSKWENNLSAPDLSLIPQLAEIFNVTCDDLLGVKRISAGHETVDTDNMVFKIKIVSADGEKMNVTLPFTVAQAEYKDIISFENQESKMPRIEMEQVISLVKKGAIGKIIEAEEDGDRVEIWVERA